MDPPVLVEPWRRVMASGVPGGSAPESMGKEAEEDEELTTNPFWGFIWAEDDRRGGSARRGGARCWYFLTLTEKSASARKYRCSTSPGSIQGIVFSTRNGYVTVF